MENDDSRLNGTTESTEASINALPSENIEHTETNEATQMALNTEVTQSTNQIPPEIISPIKILDIHKILESRGNIVHDQKKLIGSDLKSVFSGSALVDWMIKNYNSIEAERHSIAKLIHDETFSFFLPQQAIYSIENDNFFLDAPSIYYRFIEDQYKEMKKDPNVLNLNGIDTSGCKFFYEDTDPEPLSIILNELKAVVEEIYATYLDETKTLVNYKGLEESEVFNIRYLNILAQLAYINLTPLHTDVRIGKAFFMNIYNMLTIHSIIARYRSKNKLDIMVVERPLFYNTYKYCLGGFLYTMGDIEQGIFRNNSSVGIDIISTVKELGFGDKQSSLRFKGNDPRTKFVLRPMDPRVHFGLNPGTISGPALVYYNAEEIDNQLDIAARKFCDTNARLKIEKNTYLLEVSEFFKYYKSDFARDEYALKNYITSYKSEGDDRQNLETTLEESVVKIKYIDSNWKVNKKPDVVSAII